MFSFYVAGASREIDRCERMRDRLIALGLTCAHDWMAGMRQVNAAGPVADSALSREDRLKYALEDAFGVTAAQFFILLVPSNASVGAWIEFGLSLAPVVAWRALAEAKLNRHDDDPPPIVIVAHRTGTPDSIFFELATYLIDEADGDGSDVDEVVIKLIGHSIGGPAPQEHVT